jgi:hypothetical protein
MKYFLILSCLIVASCSDHSNTVQVLEKQGYKNIETHGYGFFSCDKNDFFSTKFTAINPYGERVDGVACSGFLKATTLRW